MQLSMAPDQFLIEIIKIVPSCVTALFAALGYSLASKGLTKWHDEALGKRRIELAEQILTSVYTIRDIFAWARSAGSMEGEGTTRNALPDESASAKKLRDAYFVPIERLNKHSEAFVELNKRRYSFFALFGEEDGKFFDDIHGIRTRIITAAQMLINIHDENRPSTDHVFLKQCKDIIGWRMPKDDPIIDEINDAVKRCESVCRQVIESATHEH